ncbi:reprolysin-like metallopeptidase [uncultured Chryseobacterium sp.]|uniref:reprolysin-like metallopeptidase n=1 Tax=uncultured Chryseobacterium sp. TaxID=259322 RepID=UPI002588BD4E|nr:zinc-dependent metalloprotease family protein [uncultured Chryseobacterium sp.]
MKRVFTALVCTLIGGAAFGQWTPTSFNKADTKKRGAFTVEKSNVRDNGYYKLDLALLRSQLKNAQEMGPNAAPVIISLPTVDGRIERFKVFSFPVLAKEIADKYELGSYVGTSVEDPGKYLRFSVSPNELQSMIIDGDKYEFIEPLTTDKSVYAVHPKTMKNPNGFICSTKESPASKKQIDALLKKGKSIANQPTSFAKTSDKKYRTMRLAMSVTGEYTQFFGGVAGAWAQVNNTMSRVNGVFEKDFALHLNVLNYPALIFDNPATDPYASVTSASSPPDTWNTELQNQLTTVVGESNYDIGHLFGASGGGGNAGCIGCFCLSPTTDEPEGKGSGITSPATGSVNPSAAYPPSGDNFDIDYVAHEMGHQLGANHTFSHSLEGSGVNMEPGSGSTIMGYAGITGANFDVQPHSDPYFHIASIDQVQDKLIERTCDVETSIANNPPVIAALPTYNIPKGTAFVLTASATDAENDPLTYVWEEIDNASVVINKNNIGNTTTGATFRSKSTGTSPTRYFPSFTSVMNGVLNNANNTWESVSAFARTTNFAVTIRDNNPNIAQQQTNFAIQTIVVGDTGPFKLANQYADVNTPTPIQWLVANTNAAPYNVANVKIDYTTDNGTTWTVLAASTPNDGTENFTFPSSLNGQTIKVRVSAIGNVFYAVGPVTIGPLSACSSAAPTNVVVSSIGNTSANVSWMAYTGATYKVRYRKVGTTAWNEVDSPVPSINLTGLAEGTNFEVQVALVCGATVGTYSASVNFTTLAITYCAASALLNTDEYISNVTVANINNTTGASTYSNYTTNSALQINLVKGSSYPISLSVGNAYANDVAAIYIDYNKNGVFESNEAVLNVPTTSTAVSSFSGMFTVPNTAVENQTLRMRVLLFYAGADSEGYPLPASFTCGTNFYYGEVEDYNVVITSNLATSETSVKNDGIQIYPNPATDVLNITKVSDKATYKIYSAAGQLVDRGNINDGKVNVSSLVKGAYVITIEDKGIDQFKSKFIKK